MELSAPSVRKLEAATQLLHLVDACGARISNKSPTTKANENQGDLAKIFGWKLRELSMSSGKAFFLSFVRFKVAISLADQKTYVTAQEDKKKNWNGKM